MSEPTLPAWSDPSVRIKAGGLVWDSDGPARKLCIVHRIQYDDWTLPKGKREPQDRSWLETAQREVREETQAETKPGTFAGTTHYEDKKGVRNIVLFWEMLRTGDAPPDPKVAKEIDHRKWLSPCEAFEKLTHPAERQLVAQISGQPLHTSRGRWLSFLDARLQARRLTSALNTVRLELDHSSTQTPRNVWWAAQAREFLALARCSLQKDDFQSGWTYVHEAQQLLIHGWDDGRLIGQAIALRAEAKNKLKGWRGDQVAALFGACPLRELLESRDCKCENSPPAQTEPKPATWPNLPDPVRQQLRTAVLEAQRTINGEHNNSYHRIALVQTQMAYLVVVLAVVLLSLILYFILCDVELTRPIKDVPARSTLPGAGLFGALGAILTSAYQLSRAGKRKIPESVMTGVVTIARPLVGAGAALFLYFTLASGILKIVDSSAMTVAAAFTMAFIAGFSEKLVIQTATKLSDDANKGE